MRYLTIFTAPERPEGPSSDEIVAMEAFLTRELEAGRLITTEGCLPTDRGARLRRAGGAVTVTDGPFTEAKEVVGGFAIIEVRSKDEAIELSKQFMELVGDGTCEIRELYPTPPGPVVEFAAKRERAAATA